MYFTHKLVSPLAAILLMGSLLAGCSSGSTELIGGQESGSGILSGILNGLQTGQQVTLLNNGTDTLVLTENAPFQFPSLIAYQGGYAVTVGTQPTGQTCTVSNGSGAGVTGNVSTISVTCAADTYSISGTVSGLASGQQVTLFNNGANPTTVTANGAFTFANPVALNSGYAVTVGTQPTGQTCTVSNGSGAGVTGNVSTISVTCAANMLETFTVGGTLSNLASGQQITLLNNGANPTTVTANGSFTFATPVALNSGYAVTVGTQPTGQTCTVSNGSGAGVTGNVSTISVTCAANMLETFTVGGTLSNLASGQQVTLLNNGANPTTVTANGSFTFATPVALNSGYAVTVGTQPTGQTCTVSNGTGAGVTGNVSTISVTCAANMLETFTVGGTLSNLASGQQVTLLNNGANPTTVTANGSFTFATPVAFNGSYAVTVGTQPTGQTCTVSNGSGAGVSGNVSNISVTCAADTYSISGTVSGLASGQQVTLLNNGANPTTVTANGSFTFATPVAFNGSYAVTVGTQPTGQTCTVSNGSGAGVSGNVSNISVTCAADTYSISGTVSGLASGQQVTLLNNGANPTTVTANGSFTFATPVAFNGSYAVTVGTQPTGQTCTVSNGSGAGVSGNVSNISVTCAADTYSISGTVSGLASGQQVTLLNNGANPTTVTANGSFTFATPVAFNGSYAVTVGTQPTGQTCTVSNGSGAGVSGNVSNISVTCAADTYSISGTVSGLASGQQVTLLNNGANPTTVTANGSFTFATPVAFNGSYAVTVGTQPTGQTCTVSNGSGTGVSGNISGILVMCTSAASYTISGTVTGLDSGQQVRLLNNGADPNTVAANGSFTFSTPVAQNGSYNVTVGTQPMIDSCDVTNGSGSNVVANVTNVTVTCNPL